MSIFQGNYVQNIIYIFTVYLISVVNKLTYVIIIMKDITEFGKISGMIPQVSFSANGFVF